MPMECEYTIEVLPHDPVLRFGGQAASGSVLSFSYRTMTNVRC
jgi:hypothetical protein